MQQLDIKSFDSTPIHCYLWDDVESPKGVVQISHGMCEYAGRYHEVAQTVSYTHLTLPTIA